jgi:hypothetical protein
MFARLIALLMSLPLSLTLSAAAHAQTPVAGQTTQAQSLQEEMRQIRHLIEQRPAVSPASNATTAAPISDEGENSQTPAKHGGVGISPRFTANSIPRWKNKKEPFAFADFNWLTGAFRTKVETPSQPGYKETDREATAVFMRMNSHRAHRGHNDFSVFSVTSMANSLYTFESWYKKVDKTYRVDDLDNAQNKKTGQSDKTNKGTAPASAGQGPPRRANPAPLDGIFPSSEYIGPSPLIGVPDTDPVYPLTEALWRLSPTLKESRIKVYGWVNPGISLSTSDESNIPESYAIVPNKPQLDQGILRFERLPDTVQTDHVDWGFRFTTLYGIDYRWTTAQGWFSGQLLKHNRLYGVDPVETYGLIYVPKVAKGMVIKIGRYISPPDIEAQLAPDNYLFTHSLMFTYDCYTQTGVNAAVKLNDSWTILGGIHAGCDVAPWNRASHPTGQLMARWVSKSNNDSIYGGINSINNGHFKGFHDNLQQSNITWTHRFNEKGTFVTMSEAYYIYQSHALVGGTVNFGPPRSWFRLTGPGAPIQGNAPAIGVVNYTAIKISKRNFITLRPIDYLVDVKGERTGFATTLSSWTVGLTHRFGERIMIRPELRYEHAFSAKPWDNGRRNNQFMFAMDAIFRF